ncbi:hypothetical protein [Sphingobacterium deserti]|uniref:Uncharacterized protein n=1 Tax=Sphingobacterium deserti TaxID=1229276 RepID=A0A0B8SZ99_9SPHI|nr:hypothetical protein [Sphingobacterium deserti]KGE13032.1 hypothetical protein DI53_3249 [Sphingobacterium deserti]
MKNRFKHGLPRLFGGIVVIGLVGFLIISIIKALLLIVFTGAFVALIMAYLYKKRLKRRNRSAFSSHAKRSRFDGFPNSVTPAPLFASRTKAAIMPIR